MRTAAGAAGRGRRESGVAGRSPRFARPAPPRPAAAPPPRRTRPPGAGPGGKRAASRAARRRRGQRREAPAATRQRRRRRAAPNALTPGGGEGLKLRTREGARGSERACDAVWGTVAGAPEASHGPNGAVSRGRRLCSNASCGGGGEASKRVSASSRTPARTRSSVAAVSASGLARSRRTIKSSSSPSNADCNWLEPGAGHVAILEHTKLAHDAEQDASKHGAVVPTRRPLALPNADTQNTKVQLSRVLQHE